MHVFEEFQSQDVVMKRLKKMKEGRKMREKTKDPFRKTILEKIREFVGSAFENNKSHQIRARMHWFAGSEMVQNDRVMELEKAHKISSMQKSRGYGESLDSPITYETDSGYTSGTYTEEYMSLLKENAELKNKVTAERQMPLAYIAADQQVPIAYLTDSKMNEPMTKAQLKTTTELFLSASRFAPGKAEINTFAAEEIVAEAIAEKSSVDAEPFTSTKMWKASNEFLPGEKWDPSIINFEPNKQVSVEKAGEGIIDEAAKVLGSLLTPEARLAADGI